MEKRILLLAPLLAIVINLNACVTSAVMTKSDKLRMQTKGDMELTSSNLSRKTWRKYDGNAATLYVEGRYLGVENKDGRPEHAYIFPNVLQSTSPSLRLNIPAEGPEFSSKTPQGASLRYDTADFSDYLGISNTVALIYAPMNYYIKPTTEPYTDLYGKLQSYLSGADAPKFDCTPAPERTCPPVSAFYLTIKNCGDPADFLALRKSDGQWQALEKFRTSYTCSTIGPTYSSMIKSLYILSVPADIATLPVQFLMMSFAITTGDIDMLLRFWCPVVCGGLKF